MCAKGLRALSEFVVKGVTAAKRGKVLAGFFVPNLLETAGLGFKVRAAFCHSNTFLGGQMILPAVLWVSKGCGRCSNSA